MDSYTSITELNLENNSLLYGKISVILSYTPQIKILNIKGIDLDTELRFSYLQELVELHMDYFTDCESALVIISSNVFKKLIVTNVKMPSKEATIDLNELIDLIMLGGQRELNFINCSVDTPVWLWSKIANRAVGVETTENSFQILTNRYMELRMPRLKM